MRQFLLGVLPRLGRGRQPAFGFAPAQSYYLPEGRYYAAPLVYKRRKPSFAAQRALPLCLCFGFSLLAAPALKQKPPVAFPANMTRLAAGTEPAPRTAPPLARAGKNRAQNLREDRLSRSGKGSAVFARGYAASFMLAAADACCAAGQAAEARNAASALQRSAQDAYALRFQPPRAAKQAALQMAAGFVPAPHKPKLPSLPVPPMLAGLVNNDKPDILALGYASVPANPAQSSPFDEILTDRQSKPQDKNAGRFIPPAGRSDHAWLATPLPADVFTPKQQKCLAEAVYFEARSESLKGQAAVAQVVLNRVRNPAYPESVCGVVYQNRGWLNHCQFSFACDGQAHRVEEPAAWRAAAAVARAVSAGQIWLADIGSATHYHAVYVHPAWASLMDKMEKIGAHIFYRTRGGGWS